MRKVILVLVLGALELFSQSLLADQVVPNNRVKFRITVREKPDATSHAIGFLPRGGSAKLDQVLPDWYAVTLADATRGYVAISWSRVVKDELANSNARVDKIAASISVLENDLKQLRSDQSEMKTNVGGLQKKLEESGMKALDYASQFSGIQWSMFQTGLSIGGLILAAFGLFGYKLIEGTLERKIDRKSVV